MFFVQILFTSLLYLFFKSGWEKDRETPSCGIRVWTQQGTHHGVSLGVYLGDDKDANKCILAKGDNTLEKLPVCVY